MPKILWVVKRDGSLQEFRQGKIRIAVSKALAAANKPNNKLAENIAECVVADLQKQLKPKQLPSVEKIQDLVEKKLMEHGLGNAAKAFILYRERHKQLRETRSIIGVEDRLGLSINALKVLKARYLLKDLKGNIIESPEQMFRRVAKNIASADLLYGKPTEARKSEKEFFETMSKLLFLPNSPTLMNAGLRLQQLAACFVLPVDDSIESIFETIKNMAIIQQSGGGTGFDFSRLRAKNSIVESTRGSASGPVSFIRVFDAATKALKQGGKRRGANMAILRFDHQDIIEFVSSKADGKSLQNFNLSVAASDAFMRAALANKKISLIDPKTKKATKKINAAELLEFIAESAWNNGDPGIVFLDTIEKANPTPVLGRISATNPCGELPLLPFEACNLGSINLAKMVENKKIDWQLLEKTTRSSVHFLDNVIDKNNYPLPQIEAIARGNRKIGLGVMGFADMLVQLGVSYDSKKALKLAEQLMRFIREKARKESIELAKKRGVFPNWGKSIFKKIGLRLRNATLTTIAPTGSISIIANCSSSIEPLFAITYTKHVLDGAELFELNKAFKETAMKNGFYSLKLLKQLSLGPSIRNINEIPKRFRKIFATAFDISPKHHILMQAAFQKYCDNAVSKTINLPNNASVEDVKKAFVFAWKKKCKGITVYRYGGKEQQVFSVEEQAIRKCEGCTEES